MRACVMSVVLVACARGPEPSVPEKPGIVVLISLDTTRADALSCYRDQDHWRLEFPAASRPAAATPAIDALAASGARFAWALAQAPTTLNSHATVFSGRDPHRHAVPRNGYAVPAGYPLLAEWFQGHGWDTVAVIGSSALEKKMGLGRGFRVYDDPGPQPAGGMYMRGADDVTRRALAAVDARGEHAGASLFLFVHYYDAHMPWFTAPPEVVARFTTPDYDGYVDGSMEGVGKLTAARIHGALRFGDARQARALYLAQVAWVDQQVGLLLDGLGTRGLAEDSLVVVVADHGETLDESDTYPYTHGPEVGLVDIHVPLVMAGKGRYAVPASVVERPVRLQDVGSTIAAIVGFGGILGDGEDLSPLWQGRTWPAPPAFAEATRPMDREVPGRWNNLAFERAVALDGYLLRVRPLQKGMATLHRIAPGEPRLDANAPAARPRVSELASLLQTWDATAPAWRAPEYDAETEAALRALGYLGDAPAVGSGASPDLGAK